MNQHLAEPPTASYDIPNGIRVISDLPNDIANELVYEQLAERYGNSGKDYASALLDLALACDGTAMVRVMQDCIQQAGSSEHARTEWETYCAPEVGNE